MDAQQPSEAQRQLWQRAAPAWEKWRPQFVVMTQDLTTAILDHAAIKPGWHVLDLAGGSGEPACSIAPVVAPVGTVTMADIAPSMVDIASEHARAAGLNNMRFEVCDAAQLPFEDARFDAVTCRLGVMFFPDVQGALREALRVLRPGGRATFLTWRGTAASDDNVRTVLGPRGLLRPPEPGAPHVSRFSGAGELAAELQAAGFVHLREDTAAVNWDWPGPPAEYWQFLLDASPWRDALHQLAPADQQAIEREFLELLHGLYDGTAVRHPSVAAIVSGARPAAD